MERYDNNSAFCPGYPHEKELLQAAAVIGREFPVAVLSGVMDQAEETLRATLARLQTAEFVYERSVSSEPSYIFKHALTRDAAASSLLNERRTVLHERTGRTIEMLFAGRLEEHYADLAYHYTRSEGGEGASRRAVVKIRSQDQASKSCFISSSRVMPAWLATSARMPESVPTRSEPCVGMVT